MRAKSPSAKNPKFGVQSFEMARLKDSGFPTGGTNYACRHKPRRAYLQVSSCCGCCFDRGFRREASRWLARTRLRKNRNSVRFFCTAMPSDWRIVLVSQYGPAKIAFRISPRPDALALLLLAQSQAQVSRWLSIRLPSLTVAGCCI